MNEKIIELKKFLQDKRNYYIDWTNGLVEWKKKTYQLTYKNVGGDMYPYVIETRVRPLSEIKPLINQINFNKRKLINGDYDMYNKNYKVIGIGPKAIKVLIDENKEPEYLWYHTTDGQNLLDILIKDLNQLSLLVD